MGSLSEAEVRLLHEALDDEYHAWAIYDQVVADFGAVAPFSRIREAEARHIAALLSLFDRYGLQAPGNPWPGRVKRFGSLQEACEAAVQAEIANAALYERLLAGTDRTDILAVLRKLQAASQERHLGAFQRCASRQGGEGIARGRHGRGRAR